MQNSVEDDDLEKFYKDNKIGRFRNAYKLYKEGSTQQSGHIIRCRSISLQLW